MYLNHPELVHKHPAHLASPVKRRFGTVEPPRTHVWKTSTHLASSVKMWFEKVRGCLMRLNHPEQVHEHPAHLVFPVTM